MEALLVQMTRLHTGTNVTFGEQQIACHHTKKCNISSLAHIGHEMKYYEINTLNASLAIISVPRTMCYT